MINETWLAVLESSAVAEALRGSVWAYPLVNAGHLLGVALLIGSIVPLDLRLLGFWQSVPLESMWRVLARIAGIGFAIAIVCGALLFITRAKDYADSYLFVAKMAVVAAATLNALILHILTAKHRLLNHLTMRRFSFYIRLAALLSLASWIAALMLGRLVGYF